MSTLTSCHAPALTAAPLGLRAALTAAVITAFGRLADWQSRASQRHHLASLDQRALGDLGLARADVEQEIRKPFWTA